MSKRSYFYCPICGQQTKLMSYDPDIHEIKEKEDGIGLYCKRHHGEVHIDIIKKSQSQSRSA